MVLTTELLGIKNALAESREKKVKKDAAKGKFHYPNPVFWRCKDNMDFKAQGRNLMEIGKICVEMFKEADKKGFCMKQVERCRDDLARCALEFKQATEMSNAELREVFLYGERTLGKLYRKGDMVPVRREWRGVADTAYDFYRWGKMWSMLILTFGRDLIPALNSTFHYRWMISYMCCVGFMDKNTSGQKGSALKMSHLMTYDIFRYVAENLVFLAKGDKKNGNSSELNKKVVLFDEMTMGQIMAGFPDLLGIPYQLMPVFLVSEIDQLTCVPYIDAVESFGLPADTCPVSMPCDGSTMASEYMSRRFPDLPVYHLTFPVRYEDEETTRYAVDDIKGCIKFVEEVTGAKWSWDAYFKQMKRFNEETAYELQKWEVNKTDYPQIIGPSYELFRKWNYEMDGGADPRVMKTFKKVNDIMMRAYEKREQAWRNKMRYRGIVWSCPAHYYANFSNWLANCWGIDILVEMESLNFTKVLQNVVDEMWRQVEDWRAEIIIMYQNVACKNMATLQGILDDTCRDRNHHMIWIEHDLMDPRTVSRKTMRDKVNEYMRTVMKAEPVDPTLCDFDDELGM